jgi:hypothetical protein
VRLHNWHQWTPAERELWQNMENIHDKRDCQLRGGPCSVHRPSDHHMRTWYPHWRSDRGILERICEHGIGHPDPDQFQYWNQTDQDWQRVHGCCGCCSDPEGAHLVSPT